MYEEFFALASAVFLSLGFAFVSFRLLWVFFFFVCSFICSLCVRSQLLVRIDFHCDKMWFTFLFMLSLNFRYEMEIKNRIYIQIKWKYRKMNERKFAWDYLKIKNHWKIHYILVDGSKLQRALPYLIAIPFLIFEIEKCISVAAQTKQTRSEKNTKSKRKKTPTKSRVYNGKSFSCPIEIIKTANYNAFDSN